MSELVTVTPKWRGRYSSDTYIPSPQELLEVQIPKVQGALHGAALQRFERFNRQRGNFARSEMVVLSVGFHELGRAAISLLQTEYPNYPTEYAQTIDEERNRLTIYGDPEMEMPGFIHMPSDYQNLVVAMALDPRGGKVLAGELDNPVTPVVVARTLQGKVDLRVMPAGEFMVGARDSRLLRPYNKEVSDIRTGPIIPVEQHPQHSVAVEALEVMVQRRKAAEPYQPPAILPLHMSAQEAGVPRNEFPQDLISPTFPQPLRVDASDAHPGPSISPRTPSTLLRIGGPPGSKPLPPIEAGDSDTLKGLTILYRLGDPEFNEQQHQRRLAAEAAQAAIELQPEETLFDTPPSPVITAALLEDDTFHGGQMNLDSFPAELESPQKDECRFKFGRKILRLFVSFGNRCREGAKPEEVKVFMTQPRQEDPQSHVTLDVLREELSVLSKDRQEDLAPGDHWTELRRSLARFIAETSNETFVIRVSNVKKLAKGLYKGVEKCANTKKRRDYTRIALAEAHKTLESINFLKSRWGRRGVYHVLVQALQANEWKEAVAPIAEQEARVIELRPTSRRLGSAGIELYVGEKQPSEAKLSLTDELELLLQEARISA